MEKLTAFHVNWDTWRATKADPQAIAARQRRRLSELVAFARAESPFYREKYRHLSDHVSDLSRLPTVTKSELMAAFDDWVTDRRVTRAAAEAFIADPGLVGSDFLGQYMVCTTSGSTGVPAILVHDEATNRVTNAIGMFRTLPAWLKYGGALSAVARGRSAGVFATGGHFLAAASMERRHRERPARASRSRIFSVLTPLPELVRQLNEFQPTLLASYATGLLLLAEEQRAGRLRLSVDMITSSGEFLSPEAKTEIEAAFGAKVWNNYGCSEAPMIASDCGHGWLHVHADWVILEPVDGDGRPVQPGELASSVYLTNLANRVQPVIRYELGDPIEVNPEPCPCGCRLPAIRVQGRTDDILAFRTDDGRRIRILPLAVVAVAKETPGLHRFQLIQTAPQRLTVRMEADRPGDEALVWPGVQRRLTDYLSEQGLAAVEVVRAPEPPQRDTRSGKFRHVWAERGTQA
jgi:phenylacetate-coenzyme A ligase PaaK-like adenylate-forming protein